jgi:hypothetical protein
LSPVRVTFFDREAVRRALDAYVHALVSRRADRRFLDRIPEFLPAGFPVGVDVFPYTREEIERMTAEGNHFVRGVLREGRTLFRR